jgi:pimeloyl-ACP methyl ester carboxylesterase
MQLAFRKYGSGQPLLILHGLFGQSDNWNTLAKRFGDSGFEVYTIDQRNHGLSPHSDEFSYDLMADDIHEFIGEHSLKKMILLGHSMGGKTAMFFALKYPGVLDKLVVADMAPIRYKPHHNEVLKALHSVDFSKVTTRKEAESVLNEYIPDFGTKQFLLKNIYWKDSASNVMDWRFDLDSITKNYDEILAEVPQKSCDTPSLFVRGEKSNYVTNADLPEIERRFPNYTLKTIESAGHWLHAEKPDAFFECVMDFIK